MTVPVGAAPDDAATVAVNVTGAPSAALDGLATSVVVVVAAPIVNVPVVAVDPLKLVEPEYVATIVCEPAPSCVVFNVAVPDASETFASVDPLSLNVTVPPGVPPADDTVAVTATVEPTTVAAGVVTAVVVDAAFTTCVIADDVDALKLPKPTYCAVIECVPPPSAVVANAAMPAPFNDVEPIVAPASRKLTCPVGVPPALVTVAVKVTLL